MNDYDDDDNDDANDQRTCGTGVRFGRLYQHVEVHEFDRMRDDGHREHVRLVTYSRDGLLQREGMVNARELQTKRIRSGASLTGNVFSYPCDACPTTRESAQAIAKVRVSTS